jgi:hypothetical protein
MYYCLKLLYLIICMYHRSMCYMLSVLILNFEIKVLPASNVDCIGMSFNWTSNKSLKKGIFCMNLVRVVMTPVKKLYMD